MLHEGKANNDIYMSRLSFNIVFTTGKTILNMRYLSRCFNLDISIEIIHIAFGISKIFSKGWLNSLKAGNKLFHWTVWNYWYTTFNLQKWQFYMVQTNSSLCREAQLICRVQFTVHAEVIRISIFLHYSSVLLTDESII